MALCDRQQRSQGFAEGAEAKRDSRIVSFYPASFARKYMLPFRL